jgi:hypothetical protein
VKITLYFDEDVQDSDLIRALELRGVGVIGAWAAGMRERSDEEHLLLATAQNRTLYSFDVRDYGRLQKEFLAQGRSHAGMISRQATTLLRRRADAEAAQTDRDQACGGN